MAFIILQIILLGSAYSQKNFLNISQTFTLMPETYAQIVLTSISQLRQSDKRYNPGIIELNYTLQIDNQLSFYNQNPEIFEQFHLNSFKSSPSKSNAPQPLMFDIFVFENPQNEYYLCYMDLISHQMPLEKNCDNIAVTCHICSAKAISKLAQNISNNMKQAFTIGPLATDYQCFVNCTNLSLIGMNVDMSDIVNTAGLIVIDNTDLPEGGTPGGNILTFSQTYQIEAHINDERHHYSWLVLAIFFLVTVVLGIFLCNICLSYRKSKQQQQQLSDGSLKTRSKEKVI